MGNTNSAEVDCPTCNGDGQLTGDAWRAGRHVDEVQTCPECDGAGVVEQACWACGTDSDLTRDDQRHRWECEHCLDVPAPSYRRTSSETYRDDAGDRARDEHRNGDWL